MTSLASARLTELSPDIGTLIEGLDLRACLNEDFGRELRRLLARRGMVAFRAQQLTPQDQLAVTRLFGEPVTLNAREYPVQGTTQLAILSNIKIDGKPIGATDAGRRWHTDGSYDARPAGITVLYGLEVPRKGGGTAFGSLRRVHASLTPQEVSNLRGRYAEYSYWQMLRTRPNAAPIPPEEEKTRPSVRHPVIRVHPETGEECIFLDHVDLIGIDGFTREETMALADRVFAVATDPAHVYEHAWQAHDVVMWDNRVVLHVGTPYDLEKERRLIHRSWVYGEQPIPALAS